MMDDIALQLERDLAGIDCNLDEDEDDNFDFLLPSSAFPAASSTTATSQEGSHDTEEYLDIAFDAELASLTRHDLSLQSQEYWIELGLDTSSLEQPVEESTLASTWQLLQQSMKRDPTNDHGEMSVLEEVKRGVSSSVTMEVNMEELKELMSDLIDSVEYLVSLSLTSTFTSSLQPVTTNLLTSSTPTALADLDLPQIIDRELEELTMESIEREVPALEIDRPMSDLSNSLQVQNELQRAQVQYNENQDELALKKTYDATTMWTKRNQAEILERKQRRDLEKQKVLKSNAAVKIQKNWRGFLSRRYFQCTLLPAYHERRREHVEQHAMTVQDTFSKQLQILEIQKEREKQQMEREDEIAKFYLKELKEKELTEQKALQSNNDTPSDISQTRSTAEINQAGDISCSVLSAHKRGEADNFLGENIAREAHVQNNNYETASKSEIKYEGETSSISNTVNNTEEEYSFPYASDCEEDYSDQEEDGGDQELQFQPSNSSATANSNYDREQKEPTYSQNQSIADNYTANSRKASIQQEIEFIESGYNPTMVQKIHQMSSRLTNFIQSTRMNNDHQLTSTSCSNNLSISYIYQYYYPNSILISKINNFEGFGTSGKHNAVAFLSNAKFNLGKLMQQQDFTTSTADKITSPDLPPLAQNNTQSGEVSEENRSSMVVINMSVESLTDLSSILPSSSEIHHMILNVNQLTSLDELRRVTKLQSLLLSDNKITSLPTFMLDATKAQNSGPASSLVVLVMDMNQLTEVSALPSFLRLLSANYNKIKHFSLQPNLTYYLHRIELFSNQLTHWSYPRLDTLVHLDLGNNQLKDIDGEQLSRSSPFLQTLILSQNQLEELPKPMHFLHLTVLKLNHNKLQSLHAWQQKNALNGKVPLFLPRLKKLFLQDNQISEIPPYTFTTMQYSLQELDLSFNQIARFEDLKGIVDCFSPSLNVLKLNDNPLFHASNISILTGSDIPPYSFLPLLFPLLDNPNNPNAAHTRKPEISKLLSWNQRLKCKTQLHQHYSHCNSSSQKAKILSSMNTISRGGQNNTSKLSKSIPTSSIFVGGNTINKEIQKCMQMHTVQAEVEVVKVKKVKGVVHDKMTLVHVDNVLFQQAQLLQSSLQTLLASSNKPIGNSVNKGTMFVKWTTTSNNNDWFFTRAPSVSAAEAEAEEERQRQLDLQFNQASVRIQAWYRGHAMRRKLRKLMSQVKYVDDEVDAILATMDYLNTLENEVTPRPSSSMVYGDHIKQRRNMQSPRPQPTAASVQVEEESASRPMSAASQHSAQTIQSARSSHTTHTDDDEDHFNRRQSSNASNASNTPSKRAKSEEVVEEWGITDPALMATFMKRNKKIRNYYDSKLNKEKEKSADARLQKFMKINNNVAQYNVKPKKQHKSMPAWAKPPSEDT